MRRYCSPVLLGLSLVLAFVALLSTWVKEEALDTDQWVQTSTEILEQESVQKATASYLAEQLDSPQATEKLREVLPERAKALATPLQGVASEAAEKAALRLLQGPRFQKLWEKSNRLAHSQLVAALERDNGSAIVLDLRPMLGRLAARTGFGMTSQMQERGRITILTDEDLGKARSYTKALKSLAWWSAALMLLSLVAAIWLAGDRRRTIVNAGIGLVVVGMFVLIARRIGINWGSENLPANAANKDATHDTLTVATSLLQDGGRAVVALGVVLIAGGWSLGPGKWAAKTRELVQGAYSSYPFAVHAAMAIIVLLLVFGSVLPWSHSPLALVVYLALGATLVELIRRPDEPPAAEPPPEPEPPADGAAVTE